MTLQCLEMAPMSFALLEIQHIAAKLREFDSLVKAKVKGLKK